MRYARILVALVVLAVVAETCNDGGGGGGGGGGGTPTVGGNGIPFVAVSVGNNFACALDSSGNAYCWGANTNGQLGNGTAGTANDSNLPKMVSGGLHFTQISAGYDHTCAVTTDGNLFCWGLEDYGEVGNLQNGGSQLTPFMVVPLANDPWVEASAGGHYSCGVTKSGKMLCWGASWLGELGVNQPIGTFGGVPSDQNESFPPLFVSVPPVATTPISMAAGRQHTCALVNSSAGTDKPVDCWGDNLDSEVSTSAADTCPSNGAPVKFPCSILPVAVGGYQASAVTSGGDFSCGVSSAHVVSCWGSNDVGQLGSAQSHQCNYVFTTIFCDPTPTALNTSFNFSQVSAGFEFACAVIYPQAPSSVWCWGSDDHGQLGTTDPQATHTCMSTIKANPICATQPVPIDPLMPFLQVSAGFYSACAVSTSNNIFCWGDNSRGELGDGMTGGTSARPVKVVA